MRQSEARDLRSFLAEPVEEFVEEERKEVKGTKAQLHEVGVQFIDGTETQLHGTGVRFAAPWEGTGGQLHEVGARFTQPLLSSSAQNAAVGAPFTSPWGTIPWGTSPWETNSLETPAPGTLPMLPDTRTSDRANKDDLTLQQTMPMARIPEVSGAQSGLSPLRPHRLQRYQSRGVPVSPSRSASVTPRLRPAGDKEQRSTADLAPTPQKIVPNAPSSPTLQSWERRRHAIYTWLVLLTLFLLVVLGGIGLDALIASYR